MELVWSLLQLQGWWWNGSKGGGGVWGGVLMSILRYFRQWCELEKRVRWHYSNHWSPLPCHHDSSWLLPIITSHHLHRILYTHHYLSFGFSMSWLGTHVVGSLDGRNRIGWGWPINWPPFWFNPNHLIHSCNFWIITYAIEERVRHLPAGRMFMLRCCLVLLLLHACIPSAIWLLLLDMWLVCFV